MIVGTTLFIILGFIFMAVGAFLFFGGSKKDKSDTQEIAHKNGLPILPRDQRQKPTIVDEGDALSNLAVVATTHDHHSPALVEENKTDKVASEIDDFVKATLFGNPAVQGYGSTPAPTPAQPIVASSVMPMSSSSVGGVPFEQAHIPVSKPTEPKPEHPKQDNIKFDGDALELDEVDDGVAVYDEKKDKDKLQQFDGQASVLDQHFHEQETEQGRNQKALLHNRETITLVIRPKSGGSVKGSTILQLAQDYAMKYGILKMFHRYEDADGAGQLWFSMLGLGETGIVDFDLVAMPTQSFKGLALFLSLPHAQALRGFDGMVSVAQEMADELDAEILDEEGVVLENAQIQSLRNVVASYP